MAPVAVKWFNSTKTYEFVQPDNGGTDLSVEPQPLSATKHHRNGGQNRNFDAIQNHRSGKRSADNLRC